MGRYSYQHDPRRRHQRDGQDEQRQVVESLVRSSRTALKPATTKLVRHAVTGEWVELR